MMKKKSVMYTLYDVQCVYMCPTFGIQERDFTL